MQAKGFQAITIEGDWSSTYKIHRYCQGWGHPEAAHRSLNAFKRFPTWMWKNERMLDFIQDLRCHNDQFKNRADKVGFYGLDLYSLDDSCAAVTNGFFINLKRNNFC